MIEQDERQETVFDDVVRSLAGSLQDQVMQIWRANARSEYVLASTRRRQVWHACLSRNDMRLSHIRARIIYRSFSADKDRDLIAAWFGEVPPGYIRALGRLGPTAKEKCVYAMLHRVMQGHFGSKFITHADKLNAALIERLADLPDVYRRPSILRALRSRQDGRKIPDYLEALDRLRPDIPREQIAQALSEQDSALDMVEYLHKLLSNRPFPPSPIVVEPPLRALTSADAIADAGRRFGNCAIEYIPEVHEHACYLYEWRGAHPAMISIELDGFRGWLIRQIKGPKNAAVPDEELSRISIALRAAGVGNDPMMSGVPSPKG